MLLFVLAAAAASAEPVGGMPTLDPRNQGAGCPATSRYEAKGRNKAPKVQRLNELPDADMYAAVYRRVGECEIPIIVKYGVAGR